VENIKLIAENDRYMGNLKYTETPLNAILNGFTNMATCIHWIGI
jgi:hypothetical protein